MKGKTEATIDNNALLVPVQLTAWLVNRGVTSVLPSKPTIRRWENVYQAVSIYECPETSPFSSEVNNPDPGMYVQWQLPYGLRHGISDVQNSTVTFPVVPTRWLITRVSGTSAAPLSAATAWVVESNYINASREGAAFPNPQFPANPQASSQIRLGRAVPLANWPDDQDAVPSNYLTGLTAVANGDIHFSAYQPYNPNVFSFYDSLSDISTKQDMTLNYYVMGWYDDLTQDPLNSNNTLWQAIQEELKNNPGKTLPEVLPDWLIGLGNDYLWQINGITAQNCGDQASLISSFQRTVCHGLIYNIVWPGDGSAPVGETTFDPSKIRYAVANNTADALTALMTTSEQDKDNAVPALILDAFQHNFFTQLEEVDGVEKIDHQLHQGGFNAQSSKIIWEIVASSSDVLLNLSTDITNQLDTLNSLQLQLNQEERVLDALQAYLYGIWWQLGAVPNTPTIKPELKKSITNALTAALSQGTQDSYFSLLQQRQQALATLVQQVQAAYNSLTNALNLLPAEQGVTLKRHADSAFWQVVDPVVLIANIQSPPLEDVSSLLSTRYSTQLLDSISYTVNGVATTLTTTQLTPPVITNLQGNQALPLEAYGLWQEFFLLVNALNAPPDANSLTPTTANQALPSLNLASWQQPWSPLFMEWRVDWYPIDFSHWQFQDNYYQLKNDAIPLPTPLSIYGRSTLTPQGRFNFMSQLTQFLNEDPSLSQLLKDNDIDPKDLMTQIQQWDFLSQRLDGLNQQLAQHAIVMNRVPSQAAAAEAPYATVINDATDFTPVPDQASFRNLRQGQFVIRQLSIVDSFGQTINVVAPGGQWTVAPPDISSDLLPPVAGPIVTGGPSEYAIQLPPRIIQPSRLSFNWLSAQDNSLLITNYRANPVAGWLLPNYLNQSFEIYDPQGVWLGSMTLNSGWLPAPEGVYTSLDLLKNDYPLLGGMLLGIPPASTAGNPYQDLMDVVSTTLSSKTTTSTRFTRYLAACIGHPLALVQANWTFELFSLPYQNQNWTRTLALQSQMSAFLQQGTALPLSDDLAEANFNLTLGDANLAQDGLIGFFKEGNYQQFYAVPTDTPLQTAYVSFITGQELSLPIGQPAITTLLVSPMAPVHAYSDIVPVYQAVLPQRFIDPALESLAVSFRMGPLLTKRHYPIEQPYPTVIIPKPNLGKGWSWVEQVAISEPPVSSDWQSYAIVNADQTALFPEQPYELVDGWLRLRLADATRHQERTTHDKPSLPGDTLMLTTRQAAPPQSDPLQLKLTYALTAYSTNSEQLSVNTDGSLMLVFNNRNIGDTLNVASLQITLPVSDDANDPTALTTNPASISHNFQGDHTEDWDISGGSGTFTLWPKSGSSVTITSQSYSLLFSKINVNNAAGTCQIAIAETLQSVGTDSGNILITNSGNIPITKFPAAFSLSNFYSDPINSASRTYLHWQATSVPNMTLHLSYPPNNLYKPDNDKSIIVTDYGNDRSYVYPPMNQPGILVNESTIFTLYAFVPNNGDVLTYVTSCSALPASTDPIINGTFSATPTQISPGGTLSLSWQAVPTDGMTLKISYPPNNLYDPINDQSVLIPSNFADSQGNYHCQISDIQETSTFAVSLYAFVPGTTQPYTSQFIVAVFNNPITLTAPANVTDYKPFTLSWQCDDSIRPGDLSLTINDGKNSCTIPPTIAGYSSWPLTGRIPVSLAGLIRQYHLVGAPNTYTFDLQGTQVIHNVSQKIGITAQVHYAPIAPKVHLPLSGIMAISLDGTTACIANGIVYGGNSVTVLDLTNVQKPHITTTIDLPIWEADKPTQGPLTTTFSWDGTRCCTVNMLPKQEVAGPRIEYHGSLNIIDLITYKVPFGPLNLDSNFPVAWFNTSPVIPADNQSCFVCSLSRALWPGRGGWRELFGYDIQNGTISTRNTYTQGDDVDDEILQIVITPDQQYLYLVSYGGIYVISLADSNHVYKKITAPDNGVFTGAVMDSNSHNCLVGYVPYDLSSYRVTLIDWTTHTLQGDGSTSIMSPMMLFAPAMVVCNDPYVYLIANIGDGSASHFPAYVQLNTGSDSTLAIVDPHTFTTTQTLSLSGTIQNLTVAQDGTGKCYAACASYINIITYSATSSQFQVTHRVPVSSLVANNFAFWATLNVDYSACYFVTSNSLVQLDRDARPTYTAQTSGSVLVYDTSNQSFGSPIYLGRSSSNESAMVAPPSSTALQLLANRQHYSAVLYQRQQLLTKLQGISLTDAQILKMYRSVNPRTLSAKLKTALYEATRELAHLQQQYMGLVKTWLANNKGTLPSLTNRKLYVNINGQKVFGKERIVAGDGWLALYAAGATQPLKAISQIRNNLNRPDIINYVRESIYNNYKSSQNGIEPFNLTTEQDSDKHEIRSVMATLDKACQDNTDEGRQAYEQLLEYLEHPEIQRHYLDSLIKTKYADAYIAAAYLTLQQKKLVLLADYGLPDGRLVNLSADGNMPDSNTVCLLFIAGTSQSAAHYNRFTVEAQQQTSTPAQLASRYGLLQSMRPEVPRIDDNQSIITKEVQQASFK